MSHCCFLLRVKRENTSNQLKHPLLGFRNIATCLKEIPETGGAALETTVMTSPHLADFIFEKKKRTPECIKCTCLFRGLSFVYDQSLPHMPTGTNPDQVQLAGPIKQCNGEQFTLHYETVQILLQTIIVYSDKSTNTKGTICTYIGII